MPPTGPPSSDPSHNERGSSLVEYALLLGLIAVVCVSALNVLGHRAESNIVALSDGIGGAQVLSDADAEDESSDEAEKKAAEEQAAEDQAVADQAAKDAAEKAAAEDGSRREP